MGGHALSCHCSYEDLIGKFVGIFSLLPLCRFWVSILDSIAALCSGFASEASVAWGMRKRMEKIGG